MTSRNLFLLASLTTGLLLAVAGSGIAKSQHPAQRTEELAREWIEAISNADVEKLDALYADDFELWTAGDLPFSGTRTRAQALEGMGMIDQMFPTGIRFEIIAMTVQEHRAAIEATSEGLHASGTPYHNQYHFLLETGGDKIVRVKEYMDTLHAKDVLLRAPAGP